MYVCVIMFSSLGIVVNDSKQENLWYVFGVENVILKNCKHLA